MRANGQSDRRACALVRRRRPSRPAALPDVWEFSEELEQKFVDLIRRSC
jgi:hypothetical protein